MRSNVKVNIAILISKVFNIDRELDRKKNGIVSTGNKATIHAVTKYECINITLTCLPIDSSGDSYILSFSIYNCMLKEYFI